tara:strand:+ start:75 stop:389 length:315 start_codon:yes stop_codon:yes gene_type:complete
MSKVAYGRKPSGWFVRRTDNGMLKCTDGKWRHNAGSVAKIKIWKHSTNALKYGERGVPDQGELGGVSFAKVTAYAVYDDEPIDCCGHGHMLKSFIKGLCVGLDK